MTVYDLYGSLSVEIDAMKSRLEIALGIKFEARESGHQGEYFQSGSISGEHLVLKLNTDMLDSEPAELNFPEYAVLLYLNDTPRAAELQEVVERIGDLVLLRHENLE